MIPTPSQGVIEYWSAESFAPVTGAPLRFKYKSDTDLYALAKAKTLPCCLCVAPSGDKFVVTSKDKQLRVFDFLSGKVRQQYDESAASYTVSN